MRAGLDDVSVLEHDDQVGVANRREPVGNDECRASCEQRPEAALDPSFGLDVDARRRLVENEKHRLGEKRTGERDQLPLTER